MGSKDITNQSSLLNGEMKESKMKLHHKPEPDESDIFLDVDRAMIVQNEIMDIFIKNNCTMREGYLISAALAESLYTYAMFGDMMK